MIQNEATASFPNPFRKTLVIPQLTALWAINEAVLGGVLHGIKVPITGITVGAVAVLLICLIGYFGGRQAIYRATLVVCFIKAMMSPHTPFPAYVAVLFQGLVGSLLVSGKKLFLLRCIFLGILALLESAFQKLFMLTILFGVRFWDAVNEFLTKLLKQLGAGNGPYALYIVWMYLGLHLVAGVGIGILAGRLPGIIRQTILKYPHLALNHKGFAQPLTPKNKPKATRIKPFLLTIWLVLSVLLVQAWYQPHQAWVPVGETLELIMRSVVILLAWYLLVGPLLLKAFRRWLASRQGALKSEVEAVLTLIPATLAVVRASWAASSSKMGFGRFRLFFRLLIVNLFPAEGFHGDERLS